MTDEEDRRSIGQKVRAIAAQYYAGLTNQNLEGATNAFNERLPSANPLVESALRLAEREALANYFD